MSNIKKSKITIVILCLMIVLSFSFNTNAEERTVKRYDTVQVHYLGKLKNNEVFDSSKGKKPLEFQVGTSSVIIGMNKAVMGMKVGEKKTATIPAVEAYGQYNKGLVFKLPVDRVPPGTKAGDTIKSSSGGLLQVKAVEGNEVVLDANHRLAGKELVFEIELLKITD